VLTVSNGGSVISISIPEKGRGSFFVS